MYAQSADILDVCHVHAAAFLYVCSELSYVIPPGARQLKGKNHNYSKKNREAQNEERHPEEVDTVHAERMCSRVLICTSEGRPRRAPPLPDWNQQRFGLELGSVSELGPLGPSLLAAAVKTQSLEILTASIHTSPEREIFRQGT